MVWSQYFTEIRPFLFIEMRLVFYYNTYLEATCLDLSVCKIKLMADCKKKTLVNTLQNYK